MIAVVEEIEDGLDAGVDVIFYMLLINALKYVHQLTFLWAMLPVNLGKVTLINYDARMPA